MFGFLFAILAAICPGDANGDNRVSIMDFSLAVGNFGKAVEPGTGGDVTRNGFVTILDFAMIGQNYGKICIALPHVATD